MFGNFILYTGLSLSQSLIFSEFLKLFFRLLAHTDSKCPIWFVISFWHLNVGNRSIVLNFYLQRPFLAWKIHPRPQRPKRPMKAKKGHQRPDLQKSLISSIFHVKSCINGNLILWKSCFSKIGNFHFHNIKFLKLHFVKNIKIAGFCW